MNKFIELPRFAPLIVGDESEKCRKFEDDHQGRIKKVVIMSSYSDCGKLVEATMRIKRSLVEVKRKESEGHKRKVSV